MERNIETELYDITHPETGITYTVRMTANEAICCADDLEFAQQIITRQHGTNFLAPESANARHVEEETPRTELSESSIIASQVVVPPVAEETPNSENSVYRWRESNIYLLLDIYEQLQDKFSDPGISQKRAWSMVAEEANRRNFNVTGAQCLTKMRSLKKNYKNVKDHNARSGNDRRTWKYFDRMQEIFGMRAWANPLSLISSEPSEHVVNESSGPVISPTAHPSSEPTQRRVNRTNIFQNVMDRRMEQRERHEAARQRRHEEKMASNQAFLEFLREYLPRRQ